MTVAWSTVMLLPGAGVLTISALWLSRHHRADHRRVRITLAVGLLWGAVSWPVGLTAGAAPALLALGGLGGLVVWQHRASRTAVRSVALAVALTGAAVLLRPDDVLPDLPAWPVLAAVALAAVALAVAHHRAMPIGSGLHPTLTAERRTLTAA